MSQTGDKFNLYRTRNNSGGSQSGKPFRNQNTEDLLYNSSLSDEVLEEIEKVFVTDRASREFDKSLIDDSTIRLLEELSVPHAKIALNEFAHRCKVAPEKIRKSIAGYLRGVCLKYWKIGRAATKQQLTEAYLKQIEHGERVNKRKLIEDFIGHTFTPGSQLDLLLIDSTVRKKLFQLEPCDALDVIFEFVSAVTFRTGKIRNINAYMMSMINKAKTASHEMKSIDEILNRNQYGNGKVEEEKFQESNPPEQFFEQSHQETQEWFHQKLAEKEEEVEPPNVWRNRQASQEQMYENQDSSSSGGNVSTPAEINSPFSQQEKMYLEEVIRQQNQVINNLRKKVSILESRLARYEGDPYESYDDTYFSQTPLNSFPNSPIQTESMDGLKDHGDFDFRAQFSRLHVQHDEYTRPRQRSEPVPNSHAISTHPQYSSHVYDGY